MKRKKKVITWDSQLGAHLGRTRMKMGHRSRSGVSWVKAWTTRSGSGRGRGPRVQGCLTMSGSVPAGSVVLLSHKKANWQQGCPLGRWDSKARGACNTGGTSALHGLDSGLLPPDAFLNICPRTWQMYHCWASLGATHRRRPTQSKPHRPPLVKVASPSPWFAPSL